MDGDKNDSFRNDFLSAPLFSDIEFKEDNSSDILDCHRMNCGRFQFIKKLFYPRTFVTVDNIRWLITRLIIASLLMGFLLLVSTCLYFGLYWTLMPIMRYEVPLYLQHRQDKPPSVVINSKDGWSLKAGIKYDFLFETSVADIPGIAENIGNYMVTMDIFDSKSSSPWFSSSRPTFLPYKSPIVRTASTILKLGPILATWTQESLDQKLFLAESVLFNRPSTDDLNIRITVSDHRIPFYSAKMYITAHLTGIRYFMYYWKITTAFITTMTIFMCLLITITIMILVMWSLKRLSKERNVVSRKHKLRSPRSSRSSSRDARYEKSRSNSPYHEDQAKVPERNGQHHSKVD